jgi:hypothetical protein
MYLAKNYETDSGFTLTYSVAIQISYNEQLISPGVNVGFSLPSVLLPELQWFPRLCSTPHVIARYVFLTLVSGDTVKIAYPFCPGSANWFLFWQQLNTPDIVETQGIGEKCSDKILRNLLGIT